MPLTRQEKEQLAESYRAGLAEAPHVFLIDYQGITVPQVTELRSKIRDSGGHYAVVKNRLALRAIREHALDELRDHFQGPTAVAYCEDDPVALAKTLTEFAKTVPAIEFKAGLVEGRAVPGDQVQAIAKLPARDELIAKLLFVLQSPIVGLARVLAALPRDLVVVVDQIRQGKEKSGSG